MDLKKCDGFRELREERDAAGRMVHDSFGGTFSLREKRSGTKLERTSLSAGAFQGPPNESCTIRPAAVLAVVDKMALFLLSYKNMR